MTAAAKPFIVLLLDGCGFIFIDVSLLFFFSDLTLWGVLGLFYFRHAKVHLLSEKREKNNKRNGSFYHFSEN